MKKSDRQIKTEATQKERQRVFDNHNSPQDIHALCTDGLWVRYAWRNPNGYFGWEKWKKK